MSALLALVVLGVAAWFVLTVAGGRSRREPIDSVSDFAHAMAVLDPSAPPRPPAGARPAPARRPVRR